MSFPAPQHNIVAKKANGFVGKRKNISKRNSSSEQNQPQNCEPYENHQNEKEEIKNRKRKNKVNAKKAPEKIQRKEGKAERPKW